MGLITPREASRLWKMERDLRFETERAYRSGPGITPRERDHLARMAARLDCVRLAPQRFAICGRTECRGNARVDHDRAIRRVVDEREEILSRGLRVGHDAGHAPQMQDPARFHAALLQGLSEVRP